MKNKVNMCKSYYFFTFNRLKSIKLTTVVPILLIFGTIIVLLPYLENRPINAQTYDNVISFPDVNVTDNNNQNIPLDYEFLLVGNNSQNQLEVQNPDFSLNQPFVKLIEGQKYTVNPSNDEDIKYSSISIKMAPVLFVAEGVKIQDADPEDSDDMTLGASTDIGNYVGGSNSSFVIPSNLSPGNYILYSYLHYPDGITGVFSNLAAVSKTTTEK